MAVVGLLVVQQVAFAIVFAAPPGFGLDCFADVKQQVTLVINHKVQG